MPGTYYGGSTLIVRGRFNSYDPAAAPLPKGKKRKKKKTLVHKPVAPIKRQQQRDSYLREAVRRIAIDESDQTSNRIPKKAMDSLRSEIEDSGSFFDWAKAQPEYLELFERSSAKLARVGDKELSTGQHCRKERIAVDKKRYLERLLKRANARLRKQAEIVEKYEAELRELC